MSSTDRQSRLLVTEDWKKIYQSFRNADFQSYDFDNLRRTMINYLRQNYPEDFNDYIESSEYLALIDLIAFLGQNLSFRVDLNARENFLETAERRESVLRLAKLISYNPSRNKPANGLLKFDTITTTESVLDSTGTDLSGTTVLWNDRANPNYFEQFIKILNAALPANSGVGRPLKTANIQGVSTEQYRFNSLNTDIPAYGFSKDVEGLTTRFEVVSTAVAGEVIAEEPPLPGNNPSFLYRDDGQGAGSSNTGFFMHFRQGTLESANFNVDKPIPNQVVGIDAVDINNSDIWLYGTDTSGFETQLWTKLDSVEGNNIIYSSIFEDTKNVYAVSTRTDDRINLVFSDGVFGNLPSGSFRVYYRTSDNRNMVINPGALQNISVEIPYISRTNKQEVLTIGLSLKTTVNNSRPSETNSDIKADAPATYYTQNRLITAEDYNVGPLGIDQDIIKTKTVNRISSGISKYLDLTDPTGKYSTTSLFASDGVLYKEEFLEKMNFDFVTQADIEGILYTEIEPLINSDTVKAFYQQNYNRKNVQDLNATWRQVTKITNRSTGYFQELLNPAQRFTAAAGERIPDAAVYTVASYTQNNLSFFETGALVKFKAPVNQSNQQQYFLEDGSLTIDATAQGASLFKWSLVQTVTEDGTAINNDGTGPIVFNDIIPDGAILVEILPRYTRNLSSDVKRQIVDRTFAFRDFALRYSQEDREWKVITAENINTYSGFSNTNAGNNQGQNLDSSWVFYFQTDGNKYTVSYRNLRYVFESAEEVKFFFDSADKIYDPKTGQVQKDVVTVLNINTRPNSTQPFNKDFDWSISDAFRDPGGYKDTRKIQLAFFDSDDDGIADNPDIFKDIVDEFNVTPEKRFIFQRKYSTSDGVDDYRYFDNSKEQLILIRQNEKDPIIPSAEKEGQVFYFSDFDLFKVLNKSQNNMTVTTDYRAFVGRDKLKFQYIHVADQNYRIDPSRSNIMDTFLLTRSYDNLMRQFLSGGLSKKPLPPSTDELFSTYGSSLNKIKSISDEIVYHPVKYKILFGDKADANLQASFKVVKNQEVSVNNNELRANIIDLINRFFSIENWEFGETFYFQELSTYIINQLSPELVSFIIVPKQADQTFGSLFEVRCETDEIFINGATVDNIEFIDEHSASALQSTGRVFTGISAPQQGVVTRTTSSPGTLPSSTVLTNIDTGNTGGTLVPTAEVEQQLTTELGDPFEAVLGNLDPIDPTYSLSAPLVVDEGDTFTVNLTTTDIPDGSVLSYNITGISANDLASPNDSLTGQFVVNANTAFKTFTLNNDITLEGTEKFVLTLNNQQASVEVQFLDTSIPTDPVEPALLPVSNTVGNYPSRTSIISTDTTLRFVADADPYPAKAGIPLVNDGVTARVFDDSTALIADKTYDVTFDYRAGNNKLNTSTGQFNNQPIPNPEILGTNAVGIMLNGTVFHGPDFTANTLPGGSNTAEIGFVWNSVFNGELFGEDDAGGYPESSGEYHYHSGKFLYRAWNNETFISSGSYFADTASNDGDNLRHTDGHSKIVGFAFDGYPIYGPFGYTISSDNTSGISQQSSSYRTKPAAASGRGYLYSELPAGTFVQDYEYVDGLGTLDEYNGKYCVTPDYPEGTYAYFLSFEEGNLTAPTYPYIVGPSTRDQRTPTGTVTQLTNFGQTYPIDVTNNGATSYVMSGVDRAGIVDGDNPTITVNVGDTLEFNIDITGYRLYIKTAAVIGTGSLVTSPPVSNNGSESGTISWTPDTSGTYYYVAENSSSMIGEIIVQ